MSLLIVPEMVNFATKTQIFSRVPKMVKWSTKFSPFRVQLKCYFNCTRNGVFFPSKQYLEKYLETKEIILKWTTKSFTVPGTIKMLFLIVPETVNFFQVSNTW